MKVLPLIGAAAVFLSLSVPAHAVDVANEDDQDVAVTVVDEQGSELINIAAKEVFPNICAKCSLKVGGDTVQVEGEQVAVIRGGKLTVSPTN